MPHAELYIILAATFGLFMAWGVGANDVANAMGTSVGSGAITIKQAIIIAVVFEALGAMLAGGQVTDTIRSRIIDISYFRDSPQLFIYGMLAALLSAGTWLLIASWRGWPVSTTHSIVGAVIGFGLVATGADSVHWQECINIGLSWIITPIIAGILAFLLFRSVQTLIFESDKPTQSAKLYVPIYVFLAAMVLALVTLFSGLKHLGLHLSFYQSLSASVLLSLITAVIGRILLQRYHDMRDTQTVPNFNQLEKVFGILMIFTACAMAFAHGSNDVANAIGPLAAVVTIAHDAVLTGHSPIPLWVMGLGAAGIVLGLSTYGYRVIATIGHDITQLTPSRGFAAQLATATTVLVSSGIGLPISTTQTLVGAVLGVGIARGIGAINLKVVGSIFVSWVITLPAGALLSIVYFLLLKSILG
jgi:inorganic phosphate transporter, PiT family